MQHACHTTVLRGVYLQFYWRRITGSISSSASSTPMLAARAAL